MAFLLQSQNNLAPWKKTRTPAGIIAFSLGEILGHIMLGEVYINETDTVIICHVPVCVFQTLNVLELKMRMEEHQMENEYQLCLKEMNYNGKLKELSDKFIQEIESLKAKQQVCCH